MQKKRESYSTSETQILNKYRALGMTSTNQSRKNEQGQTMTDLMAQCVEESGLNLHRVKVHCCNGIERAYQVVCSRNYLTPSVTVLYELP